MATVVALLGVQTVLLGALLARVYVLGDRIGGIGETLAVHEERLKDLEGRRLGGVTP